MSVANAVSPESEVREFERALVRFNSHVLGITAGLIAGVGLLAATLVLVLRGGENPGSMLELLSIFFPGYRVTFAGAFLGGAYAGVAGYLLAAAFARVYGPWLLRQMHEGGAPDSDGAEPLESVARLSPLPVAICAGGAGALGLFLAHHWIVLRSAAGDPALHYLSLLVHYIPGYSVDWQGSLLGAFWLFAYAGTAAAAIAWIYNRLVALRTRR